MNKIEDKRKRLLREKFVESANLYLSALLSMWEWDSRYGYWVADEIGGVYSYGDSNFVEFDDMRYVVENDVPYEVYNEWVEYNLVAERLNFTTPNLASWFKGCPRISERDIQHLQDIESQLNKEVERLKEKF